MWVDLVELFYIFIKKLSWLLVLLWGFLKVFYIWPEIILEMLEYTRYNDRRKNRNINQVDKRLKGDPMATTTEEQIRTGLQVVNLVADCIKEAERIPSGVLYARLMEFGCTLSTYESIIRILTAGDRPLVRNVNNELIWNI